MALKVPYATISEANSYLSGNDAWSALSSSQKNNYLINGRYFIDANYTCSEAVDMTAIPDEYKFANSLLAGYDLSASLFAVTEHGDNPVTKKKVKAGDVESEVEYAGNRSTSLKMGSIDKYPQVTSLLSEFCTLNSSSGVKCSSLLRA